MRLRLRSRRHGDLAVLSALRAKRGRVGPVRRQHRGDDRDSALEAHQL